MVLKVPQSVTDRMAAYDATLEPIEEVEVRGQLSAAITSPEALTAEERQGAYAEIAAFEFRPHRGTEHGRWGIYWAEQTSWVAADGTEFVSPDVAKVDEEILAYWSERSRQARHPVLRARYADLAWEIGRYIKAQAKLKGSPAGSAVPVELCWQAIDSYLAAVQNNLHKREFNAWRYLDRAIELAISVKHKDRIAQAKATLYAFYRRLEGKRHPDAVLTVRV